MSEGVVGILAMLGFFLFFGLVVIVGEWLEGRKRRREASLQGKIEDLEMELARVRSTVDEMRSQMEALLWHLKLEPKRRSWEPYYEMVEREKK